MKEKHLFLLIPVFLVEAIAVAAVCSRIYPTVGTAEQNGLWFLELMALANVLLILVVARMLSAARKREREVYGEDSRSERMAQADLLLAARSQRHDFLNHLSVVAGLLDMDRIDDAKTYLKQFCTEAMEVGGLLALGKPVIGSLILNKVSLARAQGIDTKLTVQTKLDKLRIKETYVTKILGNIIDNGIDAALAADEKKMELKVYEDPKNYVFEVVDSGTELSQAIISRMFEPMYSTKGPDRGVGLAIVQHIAGMCGAKIEVRLLPTTFVIRFNKRQQEDH